MTLFKNTRSDKVYLIRDPRAKHLIRAFWWALNLEEVDDDEDFDAERTLEDLKRYVVNSWGNCEIIRDDAEFFVFFDYNDRFIVEYRYGMEDYMSFDIDDELELFNMLVPSDAPPEDDWGQIHTVLEQYVSRHKLENAILKHLNNEVFMITGIYNDGVIVKTCKGERYFRYHWCGKFTTQFSVFL